MPCTYSSSSNELDAHTTSTSGQITWQVAKARRC
jgi:hypothetical protein